jgi:hypothetical protein
MAYIGADSVKAIRNALKAEFPEIKFSVTLDNHSSVNVSIMESPYNLINEHTCDESDIKFGYTNINHYYTDRYPHQNLYQRIWDIVKIAPFNAGTEDEPWYDRSDIMTDYFDVSYYFTLRVGKWNKAYVWNQEKWKKATKKNFETFSYNKYDMAWLDADGRLNWLESPYDKNVAKAYEEKQTAMNNLLNKEVA